MEWLTIEQAAQVAGAHKSTIYRQIQPIRNTPHVRRMGRRMQVSRAWVDANSRESPRKTVRKSHTQRQAPPEAARGPQSAPEHGPALDVLAARLEALEAQRKDERARLDRELERMDAERMRWHATLNQLTDTIQALEARTADLVALNVRLRERPPALLQVQPQAATGQYRPEPEPAQATPPESPTASLTEWLRAMQLRRNEAHSEQ